MPDLLIKNGRIVDGSGAEAFSSDIAVTGGIISHIDGQIDLPCRDTIDGSGLVVCPGFIDMHTHSDFSLLLEPKAESRVRQGVTTEVTGNCGGSPGPILPSGQDAFMEYMTDLGKYYKSYIPREQWNWKSLDEFYDRLLVSGIAVNVVPLVGHSTLRANVMGYENRPPDQKEMQQMQHLLRAELENGAFGFSSGLIYHPGASAGKQELINLAAVANDFHGIYSTHMRSEGKFLFEAVDEALSVARESGISLQISHLKCETPVMWGKSDLLLGKIDQARKEGLRVDFDQYPYTAYHTSLLEIFPFWAKEAGSSKMLDILNSTEGRQKVLSEMMYPPDDWDNPMEGLDWHQIQIVGYRQPANRALNGLTVAAVAELRKLDPLEAVFQLFCEEKGGLGMIVFAMSEKDLKNILQHPDGMIGSDGCSAAPYGVTGKSPVHPRFYGTFSRILGKYVREERVITLEQAIRKMTGLPARKLGLKNRGLIKKGMAADLVLFDPDTVRDTATFENPHQYSAGIVQVVVNGQTVIENGEHTGKLPGRRLLRDN